MSNEIKAGQQLWFVPNPGVTYGSPRYVTVDSVGRRWISFGRFRADKDALRVERKGYTSPGTCYITKDEWIAENRRSEAWSKLREAVKECYPRKGISTETIEAAIFWLTGEVAKLTPLASGKD